MGNHGSSASYWFEKDAPENQAADETGAEPVKRRIPSPLNLFARRLRQRDEAPETKEVGSWPVEPITDVVERLARERAAAEAETAPDTEPETVIASVSDAVAAEAVTFADPEDAPEPAPMAVAETAPVEMTAPDTVEPVASAPAEPEPAPQPVAPVMADPVPAAPIVAEARPEPQPMISERVVLEPTPVQPAPVAAEGDAPQRRTSRVKTTFLGFERSDGRIEDVFQKEEKAAAAPATVMFPVGWLVITDGAGRGNAIALQAGVSQIGRGEDQAVQLNYGDMAISRQNHAAIAFDHEDRRFYLGHGGKANIVRLNGKPVLSTEALDHGDKIKIGETTLQFVALCGPDFHWT